MKETKLELLRRLFKENNLAEEDVFKMRMGGKEIPIITRTGIDKIVAKNNIHLDYVIENLALDNDEEPIAVGHGLDGLLLLCFFVNDASLFQCAS